jgi:hypothetical protein
MEHPMAKTTSTPHRPFLLSLGLASALVSVLATSLPGQGDGARTYWHGLTETNLISYWYMDGQSNFNPFVARGAGLAQSNLQLDATMVVLGYTRTLDLLGRSASASLFLPGGSLSGELAGTPVTSLASAQGFGDPMVQLDINLFGAPAMPSFAHVANYELDTTLDLLVTVGVPLGEYHSTAPLNLGQNRWSARLAAPFAQRIGPWVKGERTTFELTPSVWFFTDNDDFQGQDLEQDPLFMVEAHLTRDLTEELFVSLDYTFQSSGDTTIGGMNLGNSDNSSFLGATFGFMATDNLQMRLSFGGTLGDGDMDGSMVRIEFNYGWHALVESLKHLSSGHTP